LSHDGQHERCLQEKATNISSPQSIQRTLAKPSLKSPHFKKIMELQNKKRELFSALIDDDATSLALSAEDITELLRA
jgi:hypothetical protein